MTKIAEVMGKDKPCFEDLYLAEFKTNNPHCLFSIREDYLILDRPWGTDDTRFTFKLSDLSMIQDLNNIVLRPQFDAMLHLDSNQIEFFFAYLDPGEEPSRSYVNLHFQFIFRAENYECRFDEPTKRVYELASRLRRLPSERGIVVAPQLDAFRDVQRLDKLPAAAKEYFEKKTPRSFYIKPEKSILSLDIEDIARHLNFLLNYYDRRMPVIEIRRTDFQQSYQRIEPRRWIESPFPPASTVYPIDDFILQLMEVARETSPRFAFIYYYQVFEYAGFYFVDEKAKREIRRFLRDPSVINCPEDSISELFSLLSDVAQNDEARMRKVVEEYCDPAAIWAEIENDREFFEKSITFNGGFDLPALVAKDTSPETWAAMWMPKLFDQLTKIRNCLVHARERRQGRVISPTRANSYKIARYLPVIARMAEQIALRSS